MAMDEDGRALLLRGSDSALLSRGLSEFSLSLLSARSLIRVPIDFPTLASALEAAPAGAVIEILPGVYRERALVTKSVTIRGRRGAVRLAPVQDDSGEGLLKIDLPLGRNCCVIVEGVTFDGWQTYPKLDSCAVQCHEVDSDDGLDADDEVYSNEDAHVRFVECDFVDWTSLSSWTGLDDDSFAELRHISDTRNSCLERCGSIGLSAGYGTFVTMERCRFIECDCAIHAYDVQMRVEACEFKDCGPAFFHEGRSVVEVSGCTFTDIESIGYGDPKSVLRIVDRPQASGL